MEIVIDTKGNKGQQKAVQLWFDHKFDNVTEILWCSGRGGGKSTIGLSLIFASAFMYPRTYYYVARASLTALRRYTIPTIMEIFHMWGLDDKYFHWNGQDNFFELYNKSRVYLVECSYQPSDPLFTRLASSFFTRGFIEEANEIDARAKSQLMASTGRHLNDAYNFAGKTIMCCNPDPSSYLYSQFYKPYENGTLPDHRVYLFSSPRDNKMLPKDYISNLEKTLTMSERLRLIEGHWEYQQSDDDLVTFEEINDIWTNTPDSGTKRISVDISGGKGRDTSVGVYWEGTEAWIFMNTNIADAQGIEKAIREKAAEKQVGFNNIVFDSDGIGAYLGGYLHNATEFHNFGKPIDNTFANIKAECAFKLAELIRQHKLRVHCQDDQLRQRITDELMLLKKKNTDDQRRNIISKDEMKKINGRSPDALDALIYGCYGLIKKQGIRKIGWDLK